MVPSSHPQQQARCSTTPRLSTRVVPPYPPGVLPAASTGPAFGEGQRGAEASVGEVQSDLRLRRAPRLEQVHGNSGEKAVRKLPALSAATPGHGNRHRNTTSLATMQARTFGWKGRLTPTCSADSMSFCASILLMGRGCGGGGREAAKALA